MSESDLKPRGVFLKTLELVLRLGAALGSLSIWVIGAIVCYDVTMRYIGSPTLWALEISTYLMIGAAVFASGLAIVNKDHFAVDIVPMMLSEVKRRWLQTCIDTVCLLLVTFVTYGFWKLAALSFKLNMKSPTLLQVPIYIPQTAIVIGFALMVLGFLYKIFKR